MDFRDINERGNDLPGCRMTDRPTDRPTEQIHQPEQLTNISVSNLMAVGNILKEYSFVCWAGGRYPLIYAIPLLNTFFLQWLQLWKQFLKFHCKCFVKQKFRTHVICYFGSQSSRTWKLNSKNRLRSSKQRKKA